MSQYHKFSYRQENELDDATIVLSLQQSEQNNR